MVQTYFDVPRRSEDGHILLTEVVKYLLLLVKHRNLQREDNKNWNMHTSKARGTVLMQFPYMTPAPLTPIQPLKDLVNHTTAKNVRSCTQWH